MPDGGGDRRQTRNKTSWQVTLAPSRAPHSEKCIQEELTQLDTSQQQITA